MIIWNIRLFNTNSLLTLLPDFNSVYQKTLLNFTHLMNDFLMNILITKFVLSIFLCARSRQLIFEFFCKVLPSHIVYDITYICERFSDRESHPRELWIQSSQYFRNLASCRHSQRSLTPHSLRNILKLAPLNTLADGIGLSLMKVKVFGSPNSFFILLRSNSLNRLWRKQFQLHNALQQNLPLAGLRC